MGDAPYEACSGRPSTQAQLETERPEGVKKMAEKTQEQIYIIPLRDARRAPRWKKSHTAMKDIRKYLEKHLKSTDVKLDRSINEKIWDRGAEHPPSRVRVRAMKFDDGQVQAELAEE